MLRVSLGSAIVPALFLFLLAGCSGQSIKTHPVSGKVEIKDGDVAILTGSDIELKHEDDEFLRPTGDIDSSGHFSLNTLYQGEILQGAPEGKYQARIILGDESDEGVPKRKGNPVHPRFLDFATSGLTVTVPGDSPTISLSKK
jgi:hypothetical protein